MKTSNFLSIIISPNLSLKKRLSPYLSTNALEENIFSERIILNNETLVKLKEKITSWCEIYGQGVTLNFQISANDVLLLEGENLDTSYVEALIFSFLKQCHQLAIVRPENPISFYRFDPKTYQKKDKLWNIDWVISEDKNLREGAVLRSDEVLLCFERGSVQECFRIRINFEKYHSAHATAAITTTLRELEKLSGPTTLRASRDLSENWFCEKRISLNESAWNIIMIILQEVQKTA